MGMGAFEPEPLPSGYRLGRYVIEAEISQGGMGRIYRAFDTNFSEVVGLNVLSQSLRHPDGLTRFRMAFRRAFKNRRGQVNSYGEWDGIPYAVVTLDEASGTALDVSQE